MGVIIIRDLMSTVGKPPFASSSTYQSPLTSVIHAVISTSTIEEDLHRNNAKLNGSVVVYDKQKFQNMKLSIYKKNVILYIISLFPVPVGIPYPNLAENQPTWQISTAYSGESSRAVDGGLSTDYNDNSCTHTNLAPAVWSVDLGGLADIHHVEILSRSE